MSKFNASADIVEVNRYHFVIDANSKEDAKLKLIEFLKGNAPYPHRNESINGVMCVDRESGMECRETESITIK